ncbi:MAG: hypothetical protein J4F43_07910 [Dehalococcoidia bacterium]|nr:hypothetical protein [Dehalococcoidia bacterium]
MPSALETATRAIRREDLQYMVVPVEDLPPVLAGFGEGRHGELDNETMAAQGFPGSTTETVAATGRIAGYLREFVTPLNAGLDLPDLDLMAATVVHLFEDSEQVARWMRDKFLGEFKEFVGQELGKGQKLVRADELKVEGYSDEAVGLHTSQMTESGLVSSTVVDLRVGRLLGVAYVVTTGEVVRMDTVAEMGLTLERRIVQVVLGAI